MEYGEKKSHIKKVQKTLEQKIKILEQKILTLKDEKKLLALDKQVSMLFKEYTEANKTLPPEVEVAYENIKEITSESIAVFPGEYYVLTTDIEKVKKQYLTKNPKNFAAMEGFPSMSNSYGNIYLITNSYRTLDSLYYDEDMHYPLLNDMEGVSLERINFDSPSTPDNWHSCSQEVGFATPAYLNSQYSATGQTKGEFSLSNEIFSPDNDGYNDVLSISYKLNPGTTISRIVIYNSKGQIINNLVTSYLPATEGTINWDGTTNQNQKADLGVYLIYIETINLNGEVIKYKKVATLGGRL